MMSITVKFVLMSVVLITLFIGGLTLVARKLTIDNVLRVRNEQEPKGYQFWLVALIPALGYSIFNLPIFFNMASDLGSKLSIRSLFPFLVCEIFIPVLIAFLVNVFTPVVTNISKAIIFSIPVFFIHIYHVAQRWHAGLLMVLRIPDHPFRDITFSSVKMEMLVGITLLLEVAFISWLSATTIKQALKSRLTKRAPKV
jgi:hypothetical protein